MLLDDVLLEIFDFYRKKYDYSFRLAWTWHILVHVCRRWRQIIFESPHRLDLQILCTYRTPVRKNLGIWPAFPIIIKGSWDGVMPNSEDDLIAALGHPDRVSSVSFSVPGSQLAKVVTVMQEPFPMLKRLHIALADGNAPVLPGGFLGGSAPCLQEISFYDISYPALPTLLLSASDLITLTLSIPSIGYISPEAMVAGLAALTRLERLIIGSQWTTPHPDRILLPPVTRIVLPALKTFIFRGACEYLEVLVPQINCPQLDRIHIHINYVNQLAHYPVVQLSKFVDRSLGPKLSLFRHARVSLCNTFISFTMYRHADQPSLDWHPERTIISCEGYYWQVSDIAQILSQFSATLSNVDHLELRVEPEELLEDTDEVDWIRLLHQFSAVQTLYVSQKHAEDVALALEGITGEMVTEVLPSLDLICLGGQPASSVGKFVATRQLSDSPVTFVDTKKEFYQRLMSYISE
jgi:hypothetical protein